APPPPPPLPSNMPFRGVIFDIDGTLVDTNPAHVEAWRRAFQRMGYDVPVSRIVVEIGKGGDLLVPSILGEQVEKRHGETLRKLQKEEFLAVAERERFRVFPCVPELFHALRERRIRTALATSSDTKHLTAVCRSAGLDLPDLADILVTKDDAEASKPEPDLVIVARQKLGLGSADCAMVGDTIYDGQACRAAGVVFLGLESGGTPAEELLEAGARGIWRDTGQLYTDLDHALELAAPSAAFRR
ncbi:MAG: HAD-superfamily hydrolase, subfamily variant 3, partial [Geminicoccaceae bacterium]|nr:HAD-superfamily hydrolase, subfamily variant 3 [Geminicoccaceae bacterium]